MFTNKRANDLSTWLANLMHNGALVAEKAVVRQLAVVFLSGTPEAWREVLKQSSSSQRAGPERCPRRKTDTFMLCFQAKDYALSILGKSTKGRSGGLGAAAEADAAAQAAEEEAAAAAKAEEETKAKEASKKKSSWGFSALSAAASSFAASVNYPL